MSRTFVMVKPDATERGLTGEILSRFEKAGFRILALRYCDKMTKHEAEFLYDEHKERAHFPDLVAYTTSGPVVMIALEAQEAPARGRELIGPSDITKAEVGTIRRDLGLTYRKNSVHGSDGPAAAARELGYFFPGLAPKT